MNILVTGCAGYLGGEICERLLRAGHFVIGLDNLMYDQYAFVHKLFKHPCFEFYKQECMDVKSNIIHDVDIVIPLAAIVGAPACDAQPKKSEQINVEQMINIVRKMKPNQKIIYPNSNSGLGKVDGIADENSPRNAVSLYGRQKDEAEEIVKKHPYHTVFRLATVFGASWRTRTDLLVNSMCHEAYKDAKIKVFDPHYRRNFIHVSDIGRAFLFAVEKPLRGVYNLGNDELNTTKMKLASKIAHYIPSAILTVKGSDPDQRDYEVSSKKLYDEGFRCKYTLVDGIYQMRRFYINTPEELLKYTKNVNYENAI